MRSWVGSALSFSTTSANLKALPASSNWCSQPMPGTVDMTQWRRGKIQVQPISMTLTNMRYFDTCRCSESCLRNGSKKRR